MSPWLTFVLCLAGVVIPLATFWTSRRRSRSR